MSSPSGRQSSEARKQPASTVSDPGLSLPLHDAQLERLAAEILDQMAAAWHAGQPSQAESWLERHPSLAAEPQAAVRIIFEEVCLREELGQQVASAEIYARFPRWKDELEVVLDCHRLMQDQSGVTLFPEPGERLGDLELLRELGRGGQGRVFLCKQPSLSDRPLVVKLTPRTSDEHLSMARLQHTHIAPLYLVQDFPEENLRALCMPYLGGATWSYVLHAIKRRAMADRTGRDIAAAVDAANNDAPSLATGGPGLAFLARSGYVEAVCWIGSCLADALHYAHQRGLVHLDIKPSNVLLADDGQPMLLDFHLAREVVPAGHSPIDRLGGTRGYMSQEQELATAAVRDSRAIEAAVDGRSDIYSLGVLLYESLAGTLPPPDETSSRRAMRHANPDVSRGLEDIVHKCLARDAAARYADAGQMAADLRRHLASLPLRGVPNRSRQERWQKWRRRNPHALAIWTSGLLAAGVLLTAGLLFHRERVREARQALTQAQQAFDARDFADAARRSLAGQSAIRWFPWQRDLKQSLAAKFDVARHAQMADAVHMLVVQLGFVDGVQALAAPKLQELMEVCEKLWHIRKQIAPNPAAGDRDQIDSQLRTDLLDLALLWSRLRVQMADPAQQNDERRAAVQVLGEVQELCGTNSVVALARHQYAAALGEAADSDAPIATGHTAWDHLALGRLLLESAKFSEARREFAEAIRVQPNGLWQNFYAAVCDYRLGDFQRALNAASVCVALSPKSAECYHNRALCNLAAGNIDDAGADLTRALEIKPSFAASALQRGMLNVQMGKYDQGLSDLQTALDNGAEPTEAYHQMALIHLARQDRAAARKCLAQALRHDSTYAPAVSLEEQLDETQ